MLQRKLPDLAGTNFLFRMKYSKWIGILACIALGIACYLPWTYHADVHKNFTGFYSEQSAYGKPGKTFIFLAVVAIALFLAQKVWAQRTLLFVSGVMIAYGIKSYILYTSCYNAYCPEKLSGIYLIIFLPLIIFMASLFPDMQLKPKPEE